MDVPSLSNAPLSTLTYSAWFWLNSYSPYLYMPLMGRIVCDSGSCGAIGLVSQQIAYFTGGAGYVMNQSAPLSTWHQVVFTLDN